MRSILAMATLAGLAVAKPVAMYPRQAINNTANAEGTGATWNTLRSNVGYPHDPKLIVTDHS